MAYADKCYVGKRVKLELLSQDDVKHIHEATLDVIETVGVKFHSQNALDILEANGASVDRQTTVAKIPAAVVEQAMSTAPHEYTYDESETHPVSTVEVPMDVREDAR